MKLNKLFMLGLAGLAFAACSSDDEVTSALDGDAMVRVNIVTAGSTRSVGDPVGGNDFNEKAVVVNKVVLKLTAVAGGDTKTFTSDGPEVVDGKTAIEKAQEYTFQGVRNPKQMEIFINDGKSTMTLGEVYKTGLAAPMYASANATDFTLVKAANSQGKYKIDTYEVTLTPQHKTALLEFSGIKHDDNGQPCAFKSMTFKGLFMNKIVKNETVKDVADFTSWADAIADSEVPTWDKINGETGENFLEADKSWPAGNQCFTYNVFGKTTKLPILTLYFDGIETNEGYDFYDGQKFGYASVKKYKLKVDGMSEDIKKALGVQPDNSIEDFVPGYVYRINNLSVPDDAIGPTPEGGEDVNVVVATVTVAPWTLVSGTVEWN